MALPSGDSGRRAGQFDQGADRPLPAGGRLKSKERGRNMTAGDSAFASGPAFPYIGGMAIFPRPVSPKSAMSDLWSYFRENRPEARRRDARAGPCWKSAFRVSESGDRKSTRLNSSH